MGAAAPRSWRAISSAPRHDPWVTSNSGGFAPSRLLKIELLEEETKARERVMLGLRLDEPLPLDGLESSFDEQALERLARGGLVERGDGSVTLTKRGRFLGGGVTARLLA